MKILIFSLVYYPNYVGGAEIAVKELTDRLGSDFEFHMITLVQKAIYQKKRLKCTCTSSRHGFDSFKIPFPFTACKKLVNLS